MVSTIILFFLMIFGLALLAVGGSHLVSIVSGAPNVSSARPVVRAALELAKARRGEKFIDLGCGWGAALAEAQKFGLDTEGVDISPAAIAWNRLWGRKVKLGNLLTLDLGDCDMVYIYLLPKLAAKLAPNFKTAKSGARIVAIDFPLPDRKPAIARRVQNQTIYLYK